MHVLRFLWRPKKQRGFTVTRADPAPASTNERAPNPPKEQRRKSCSQLSKSYCTFCDFYGGPRNNEASRSPKQTQPRPVPTNVGRIRLRNNEALCSPKQTQSGPAPANVGQDRPRNNVANRAVSFVPKGLRVRAVSRRIQTPHGRRWYSHVLLVSSRLTSSGAIREFKSP